MGALRRTMPIVMITRKVLFSTFLISLINTVEAFRYIKFVWNSCKFMGFAKIISKFVYTTQLISKIPVNSDIAFVSYAQFTVSYCLYSLLCWKFMMSTCMNRQLKGLFCWMCKKHFAHKHTYYKGFYWCKNLNFFGEKWGRWGSGWWNGPLKIVVKRCELQNALSKNLQPSVLLWALKIWESFLWDYWDLY